jgi:zinc transporter 1/2/3
MILIVSFVGITIPVYLVRVDNIRVKYAFDILRCLSIGLILGVALLHMLPEADGILGEAQAPAVIEPGVNETLTLEEEAGEPYPFAFLFAGLGVVLMLFLEQIAEHLAESSPTKKDPAKAEASVSESQLEAQHEGHNHANDDLHSHHDATLAAGEDKVKAYVIEMSISLHSILIGVGLGVLTEYTEIQILLVALCFHQLFEGIALGGAVVKANQSKWFLGALIFFFSFSCPLGVAIGSGISNSFDPEDRGGLWTQGVLYSIACGTLLYIGLYDLMAQSFQKSNRGVKKFGMVFAVLVGVALMALLAVWA